MSEMDEEADIKSYLKGIRYTQSAKIQRFKKFFYFPESRALIQLQVNEHKYDLRSLILIQHLAQLN